jgi:hypothetical protein
MPNSDGPRRIANQAMVAGSSSTKASPPSRKLVTSASLPGFAIRRTTSPTVTIVVLPSLHEGAASASTDRESGILLRDGVLIDL